MATTYDREAEDLGNVIALEHVNVRIPDQRLSTAFHIVGLGLTRDPYLMPGLDNMWVNVGRSQFHLPTGGPDVVRGHIGLVLPDREALLERLVRVKGDLDGTQYSFTEQDTYVEVVSPWGNRFRCYEPDPSFGPIALGMPYVAFDVPVGAAAGIARFYTQILETRAEVVSDGEGTLARCSVGKNQHMLFRETDRPLPEYDGHHVQIYVANFSRPHDALDERGLVFEESDRWQYRFRDIVDPESGEFLFTIEHEVRSMTHPLFGRPFVNRNPSQSNQRFVPGHEEFAPFTA